MNMSVGSDNVAFLYEYYLKNGNTNFLRYGKNNTLIVQYFKENKVGLFVDNGCDILLLHLYSH